ncbi:MAG: LamG-like jellyroll fold domain-containing protein [Candidatus Pacearchaeota archaeon]
MEKRGQTSVLTIILIVLISITAVIILWNVVSSILQDKTAQIDSSVLTNNLGIKEIDLFVTGLLKITLQNTGKGEINELKFVFYDIYGRSHIENRTDSLKELETKAYSFNPIPNFGKLQKISVYPVSNNNLGVEVSSEAKGIFNVPKDLISWWRFEDANDFVGNNEGQLMGVIANGELSGAGYFEVQNNLNLNKEMAISFFISPSANGIIFEKGDNYQGEIIGNKIRFSPWNLESEELNFNDWNHVVITMNSLGTYIYINGNLAETGSLANLILNENSLKIYGINKIDEFMIFNRSLVSSEVSNIYNNLKR